MLEILAIAQQKICQNQNIPIRPQSINSIMNHSWQNRVQTLQDMDDIQASSRLAKLAKKITSFVMSFGCTFSSSNVGANPRDCKEHIVTKDCENGIRVYIIKSNY